MRFMELFSFFAYILCTIILMGVFVVNLLDPFLSNYEMLIGTICLLGTRAYPVPPEEKE